MQQTLIKSFTLGGVGLHTGEYAVVRVRPAFAGEGRYFVRVPDGTNDSAFQLEGQEEIDIEDMHDMAPEPELEAAKIELFKEYLLDCELAVFDGPFKAWLHARDAERIAARVAEGGEGVDPEFSGEVMMAEAEDIQGLGPREAVIPAHIDSVVCEQGYMQVLGGRPGEQVYDRESTVVGAEQLLAALEACGVDNARIEIEGGFEIPVLDGSALGWTLEVQFAGLRVAPQADGSPEGLRRMALRPTKPVTVCGEDGAYVSFVPEATQRVTAGVNLLATAPVIGKQWYSWCLYEDLPFRFELAPARRYAESPQQLLLMRDMGLLKAGSEGAVLIAFGDRWYDNNMVRFQEAEQARHEAVMLVGALALNAEPGEAGLPVGHVVSYKGTPELHAQFVRALRQSAGSGAWVPVMDEGAEGEDDE